jgi:integrase
VCTAILKPALDYGDSMGYKIERFRPEKWIRVKGRKKDRYFTSGELSKLQDILFKAYDPASLHSQHITILELLMYTGCRCSEIRKLRWSDIFLEEGYIQLWKTKTKKGRIIPIISCIDTLIKRMPKTSNPYVFFSRIKQDQPMTYAAVETFWLSLMKKGHFNDHDIERMTIHSLRHTYITAANRSGISPWTITTLVGHSAGNSITGLYIHHNLTELKKAQEQIVYTLINGTY